MEFVSLDCFQIEIGRHSFFTCLIIEHRVSKDICYDIQYVPFGCSCNARLHGRLTIIFAQNCMHSIVSIMYALNLLCNRMVLETSIVSITISHSYQWVFLQQCSIRAAQVGKSGVSCPTRHREIKQLTPKHTGRKDSINNLHDLMHGHFINKC